MDSRERKMLELLRSRIAANPEGRIRFDEFMELCLYAPGLGYYAADRVRTGREGDYYTSAYVGSVMGEMLARWIAGQAEELFPSGGPVRLAEWGGGTGRLAARVLDELERSFPEVYARVSFASIERNPAHLLRQREELDAHRDRTNWPTEEEWFRRLEPDENWIVWSNELVDAFPVRRLEFRGGAWREHYVAWDSARERLVFEPVPLSDREVLDRLRSKPVRWREGQVVELNLRGEAWLRRLLERLPRGSAVLTADYGDTDEELYAPHRLRGTLIGYRRHQIIDDPLAHPGGQDLTAHVNFGDLIAAGTSLGLKRWAYMTQREFLLRQGILDRL